MGGDDRALRMKIKPKRRGGRIGGSILESARAHFFWKNRLTSGWISVRCLPHSRLPVSDF